MPRELADKLRPGRSPSWGAWIETFDVIVLSSVKKVAPPRGERGLKQTPAPCEADKDIVAPPRGERGLKHNQGAVKPPR